MQEQSPSDIKDIFLGLFCVPEFQKLNLLKFINLDLYEAGYLHPSLPEGIDYITEDFSPKLMNKFLQNNRDIFFEALNTYSHTQIKNAFLNDLFANSKDMSNYIDCLAYHNKAFTLLKMYSFDMIQNYDSLLQQAILKDV
jgi:hypothetical protein